MMLETQKKLKEAQDTKPAKCPGPCQGFLTVFGSTERQLGCASHVAGQLGRFIPVRHELRQASWAASGRTLRAQVMSTASFRPSDLKHYPNAAINRKCLMQEWVFQPKVSGSVPARFENPNLHGLLIVLLVYDFQRRHNDDSKSRTANISTLQQIVCLSILLWWFRIISIV